MLHGALSSLQGVKGDLERALYIMALQDNLQMDKAFVLSWAWHPWHTSDRTTLGKTEHGAIQASKAH